MQVTPWLVLDVVVLALIAPLSVYAFERYRRRDRRQELLAFGTLTLGIVAWELTSIAIEAATTEGGKLLWYNLGNTFTAPFLLYAFLWFAVAYSQFEAVDRRWLGLVGVGQVLLVGSLFVWWPEFMYQSAGLLTHGPTTVLGVTFEEWIVLDRVLGLPFKLYQLYIYALTVLGGAVLARYLGRNRSRLSTRQTVAIAVGVASPILVNALVFSGLVPPEYNLTDAAFGVTGLAFAVATFRYNLFRLVPVGREQLVETMADPVIMIDSQNRVVDSNPAARELVGAPDSWRGMDAAAFLGPLSGLQDEAAEPSPTEFQVDEEQTRHFDLDRSRIEDTHGRCGQLLVLREITERKVREEILETQRDDLEVLNTMMRHDIRNDLQLVTAYADLLAEDVSEDSQPYLDQIQSAATEAIDITKSARDVTEVLLSAGGETSPVRVDTVLEAELTEVSETYDSATIELRETVDPVQVEADEMLESVFRNLLTNAVDHNDTDRPEVEVATEIGADTVRISVADDGPGIPPEKRESIFAKGETGLESDGTGLGLYLVETLVDRYGGAVWIEDNEPRGAVFVVELPRVS